jgi:TolB protein
MKKIFILFLIPQFIFAELVLEITKGSDDPFVIALLSFDGKKALTDEVDTIISNDLKRTGEFKIIKDEKLLSSPSNEEDINFNEFKLLGIDYIVMGVLESEDKFNLSASYEIYNVVSKKKIRTSKVFGIPNKIKQLSHYISDGIYEEITGIKGVASTKILYITEIAEEKKSLYELIVADADGANEQVLLKSYEPIISPAWSPDSKQVAYVSFETGIAKVYIQDIATGKRRIAIENTKQISSPSWSPNGNFLSMTMYQDGNAEIYILNLKNNNLTRLTNHYAIDTESSWSSDGSRIMFTSGRSGSPQLYEIKLRKYNSNPERITFEGNYNAKGSYLKNGDGIIFVHRADNDFKIALKYFNENFIRPLTESKLDESPSISPNGNVIIYAVTENGESLLSGLTLSGAKFRLPAKKGEVREPAWSGFLR